MNQSLADPCVFCKLGTDVKLQLCVGVIINDCVVTTFPADATWFIDEIEKRFKISRGGILKKQL